MLARARVYNAAVRMRLDTSQLPKPFQLNALGVARVEPRLRLVSLDVDAMTRSIASPARTSLLLRAACSIADRADPACSAR